MKKIVPTFFAGLLAALVVVASLTTRLASASSQATVLVNVNVSAEGETTQTNSSTIVTGNQSASVDVENTINGVSIDPIHLTVTPDSPPTTLQHTTVIDQNQEKASLHNSVQVKKSSAIKIDSSNRTDPAPAKKSAPHLHSVLDWIIILWQNLHSLFKA